MSYQKACDILKEWEVHLSSSFVAKTSEAFETTQQELSEAVLLESEVKPLAISKIPSRGSRCIAICRAESHYQLTRCILWSRSVSHAEFWNSAAFATMPEGASYGQEGRMEEWSREILRLYQPLFSLLTQEFLEFVLGYLPGLRRSFRYDH